MFFLFKHSLQILIFDHVRSSHRIEGDSDQDMSCREYFDDGIFDHCFNHLPHRASRRGESHEDGDSRMLLIERDIINEPQRENINHRKFWIIHSLQLCFNEFNKRWLARRYIQWCWHLGDKKSIMNNFLLSWTYLAFSIFRLGDFSYVITICNNKKSIKRTRERKRDHLSTTMSVKLIIAKSQTSRESL